MIYYCFCFVSRACSLEVFVFKVLVKFVNHEVIPVMLNQLYQGIYSTSHVLYTFGTYHLEAEEVIRYLKEGNNK